MEIQVKKWEKVKPDGTPSNKFSIIGRVVREMNLCGYPPDLIHQYRVEALADETRILETTMRYCDVC